MESFFLSCRLRILLVLPLSEAFDREHAAQGSGEAELSLDPFFAAHPTDHGFNERRRRLVARRRYSITNEDNEDNEDDDDASHSERVHEIIEGLHNARGLLERGVETGKGRRLYPTCIHLSFSFSSFVVWGASST